MNAHAGRMAGRNLAAEARAVEAGHLARAQPDGSILVTSDTHHGKAYRVTFVDRGLGITFDCRPEGSAAYADDHLAASSTVLGLAPCMHAALAARRLEREGLAELNPLSGLWRVPPALQPEPYQPDDPFDGLP